jgi:hypothetical protein
LSVLGSGGWRWSVRKCNAVHSFPVIRGYHLDGIPRASIEKGAIRPFADALLTANAEIRVNFDAAKRRMVFIRYPEHACFDGTVFDASR